MLLIEQFLEMMLAERGVAKNSAISYSRDLNDFAAYMQNQQVGDLTKIIGDDIRGFIYALSKHRISSRSIARKISALRSFYNFLISESLIKDNPTQFIDLPKYAPPLPIMLSAEEIKTLLLSCDSSSPENIRIKAMISLLYASGLRVSELVSLKTTNLSINPATSNINNYITVVGKGSKERIVIINAIALQNLQEYLIYRKNFLRHNTKDYLYLFPSISKLGHMTRQNFALLLKSAAIKANLDPNKISPHVLRHSFASHLLAGGADLRVIQELLGHADISTTQIYTHIRADQLKEVVEKHHPLSK